MLQILTEWKANTKRKSREIFLIHHHTGGGPPSKKKLTDLEERLLSVITKIHLGDDLLPDTLGGNIAGVHTYRLLKLNACCHYIY